MQSWGPWQPNSASATLPVPRAAWHETALPLALCASKSHQALHALTCTRARASAYLEGHGGCARKDRDLVAKCTCGVARVLSFVACAEGVAGLGAVSRLLLNTVNTGRLDSQLHST